MDPIMSHAHASMFPPPPHHSATPAPTFLEGEPAHHPSAGFEDPTGRSTHTPPPALHASPGHPRLSGLSLNSGSYPAPEALQQQQPSGVPPSASGWGGPEPQASTSPKKTASGSQSPGRKRNTPSSRPAASRQGGAGKRDRRAGGADDIDGAAQDGSAPEDGASKEGGDENDDENGKKMFQCKGYGNCRMSFSRSEHLARHIRKHTGERPFKCHCGRDFSRLDNLRQHAQTVHADQSDKNTEMMQRLQSVHSALSASNRVKRTKTATSAPGPPAQRSGPAASVPATSQPVAHMPEHPSVFQQHQQHPGHPYYQVPMSADFPPQEFNAGRPQMMDPYYEGGAPQSGDPNYSSYALYPSEFSMPGRPTLPPISALIPRQGGAAAAQQQNNGNLLPSPLPPSAQIYAGHTSPVYAYPESLASPRSAGPEGPTHPHPHPHHHQQPHPQHAHYAMPKHGRSNSLQSSAPITSQAPYTHLMPPSYGYMPRQMEGGDPRVQPMPSGYAPFQHRAYSDTSSTGSSGASEHPMGFSSASTPSPHAPHQLHSGSPMSPNRMQQQQAQAHAQHHQPAYMDEYGHSYYGMPPPPQALGPMDDHQHPASPFALSFHQGAPPPHPQKVPSPVPGGQEGDGQHGGGINDLLHAATTAVTPVMPSGEFFSPAAHGSISRQTSSMSPMPGSHHGTPATASPAPGVQMQMQQHPQRRASPGKRTRQEADAEYMDSMGDAGQAFKRPMLATV